MDGDFIIATQEGTGIYRFYHFGDESSALRKAAMLWCCFVLFKRYNGSEFQELTHGGVGFVHGSIRTNAITKFKAEARNVDARANAAAAAEARMAAAAASKPKPKPQQAALGGRDGKPDVSNPVTWE